LSSKKTFLFLSPSAFFFTLQNRPSSLIAVPIQVIIHSRHTEPPFPSRVAAMQKNSSKHLTQIHQSFPCKDNKKGSRHRQDDLISTT
jgi:hypothetical protein